MTNVAGTTPLTLDLVIERLIEVRDDFPELADRPVCLVLMEEQGDGLTTDVDVRFIEAHGPITTLVSWRPAD